MQGSLFLCLNAHWLLSKDICVIAFCFLRSACCSPPAAVHRQTLARVAYRMKMQRRWMRRQQSWMQSRPIRRRGWMTLTSEGLEPVRKFRTGPQPIIRNHLTARPQLLFMANFAPAFLQRFGLP
jgi:hypothetical protein